MKTTKFFIGLLFFAVSALAMAEKSPVLMTIDGHDVTKAEFEYIYHKNNTNNAVDKKTLDEYVELFKNFKLKVVEAQHRGLDTLPAFVNELRGYRNQLAKPYLTDMSLEDKLCREAYEHLKQDVEVSHILIKIKDNPSPTDTLAAYQKALRARKRLMTEGFDKVAPEVSDDPSVAQNKGYLGFFTGGMLVYPFEKAMYELPVGEISQPVRTFYGYHIIKVHSRRPSRGQVQVSHIIKVVKADASEAEKEKAHKDILAISARLKAGEDFEKIARMESDDKGSAARGGELTWFGVGRMVREFEDAAFALTTKGQVSEPVQTAFGWHIIRLNDRRGLEPYDKKKPDLIRAMQRDERASMGRKVLVDRLKKEYNYQVIDKAMKEVTAFMMRTQYIDSTFMKKADLLNKPLATFADKTLYQNDLLRFIALTSPDKSEAMLMLAEKMDPFVQEQILAYEDTQLENKYDEFRFLMQEYHDGILLFDVSNTEVWEKAAKDVDGLKAYFAQNQDQYAWPTPHYKGRIVACKDAATAKMVKTLLKKLPADSVGSYLNTRVNNDSVKLVKTEVGVWKQGDNPLVDKYAFKVKKADVTVNEEFPVVVVVGKMLKKGPESYTDVRGAVTADYQNELDRLWIEKLRAKYPIVVNQAVLKTVKE